MPRRTKEEAAETRRRILEAALDVFSRKGYSHTTFVDIAREIGLTKGAIYWHFKTKPDLLVAMISHVTGKNFPFKGSTPNSIEEFRQMLHDHRRLVTKDKHFWKLGFFTHFQIEWSEELMTEVHEKLNELRANPHRKMTETLTHLQEIGELCPEADVETMVLTLFAMWLGAVRLLLTEKCSVEQFHTLLERHFEIVVGRYATRVTS